MNSWNVTPVRYLAGRTLSLEWRLEQLRSLLRLLDENEAVFVESLGKDLRKPFQARWSEWVVRYRYSSSIRLKATRRDYFKYCSHLVNYGTVDIGTIQYKEHMLLHTKIHISVVYIFIYQPVTYWEKIWKGEVRKRRKRGKLREKGRRGKESFKPSVDSSIRSAPYWRCALFRMHISVNATMIRSYHLFRRPIVYVSVCHILASSLLCICVFTCPCIYMSICLWVGR